mgnify:FL=1
MIEKTSTPFNLLRPMAKETAEQKLLKIIENADAQSKGAASGASADTAAQAVANSVKGTGFSFPVPPAFSSFLSFFKKDGSQPALAFGLKEFNQAIILAVLLVFVLFVMDLSKGLKSSSRNLDFSIPRQAVNLAENIIPQPARIEEYLAIVQRRNIFQPFEKKEEEEKVVLTPKETRRVVERTKDLKLVGISWLDSAESASALIENTQSGMTYFLRTGDKVNDVSIKQIFADSVIVSYEGEEIKLNL